MGASAQIWQVLGPVWSLCRAHSWFSGLGLAWLTLQAIVAMWRPGWVSFPCPLSGRLCSSPLGPGSFVGLALCPLPGGLRWEGGRQVGGLGFERWTWPQPCPTMSCPGQKMVTGGGDTVGMLWLLLLEGLVSGLCPDCVPPCRVQSVWAEATGVTSGHSPC